MALLSTWLNLEPSYLAQLCTYTGGTHREEIMHLSLILSKLQIFKKYSHFALLAHLAYIPDTKFINDTHIQKYRYTQTHAHRHTQTDTDIIFTFYTFWLIWHTCIPQTYTCTDTQTCTHTHTCTETLTHRYRYTETHACGKSIEIISSIPL